MINKFWLLQKIVKLAVKYSLTWKMLNICVNKYEKNNLLDGWVYGWKEGWKGKPG